VWRLCDEATLNGFHGRLGNENWLATEREAQKGLRMKVQLCDDGVRNLFTHTQSPILMSARKASRIIGARNVVPLPQRAVKWLLRVVIKVKSASGQLCISIQAKTKWITFPVIFRSCSLSFKCRLIFISALLQSCQMMSEQRAATHRCVVLLRVFSYRRLSLWRTEEAWSSYCSTHVSRSLWPEAPRYIFTDNYLPSPPGLAGCVALCVVKSLLCHV